MKKDNLHEPFELVLKEFLDECPRGLHAHSFFELVYIVSGTGSQCINNTKFEYRQGHLFLLAPDDAHYFDIQTSTQFFFIRFNQAYVKSTDKQRELIQRLEMILRNAGHDPGCVLKHDPDKKVVRSIMEAIINEHQNHGLYNKELVRQFVNTLLVIVARNISLVMPAAIDENSENKAVEILQYIHENIYNPDQLRVENLSKHFGISDNYLGKYFRKHTGESLQQYILGYKLKLVENRLLHSNMRVGEIADEFGFTDKSHLIRTFKKYYGANPGDFKKSKAISTAV